VRDECAQYLVEWKRVEWIGGTVQHGDDPLAIDHHRAALPDDCQHPLVSEQ
jgi:hypothetical protein